MFNLKCSHFGDFDIAQENTYRFNDNLYKIIFDFCDSEDLLSISSCSKKFKSIASELDYKFKSNCEENYCSNYQNYE